MDMHGNGSGPRTVERKDIHGIVVADGRQAVGSSAVEPRILAFIWGGKTRPSPTLPFGRWKGAA